LTGAWTVWPTSSCRMVSRRTTEGWLLRSGPAIRLGGGAKKGYWDPDKAQPSGLGSWETGTLGGCREGGDFPRGRAPEKEGML